jgi:hypothetical protein
VTRTIRRSGNLRLVESIPVLFAERVVNLMLKLNVRANFAEAARRSFHIHLQTLERPDAGRMVRPADFAVLRKR